jgi:hypothetical protein
VTIFLIKSINQASRFSPFQPRGGVPLAGMAAVLAEFKSGGGKNGLKKAPAQALAGALAMAPPRGAR